ncbi:MAG TPA: hypothetical protein VEL79_16005 [Vicinamibacterales bacterium]|nr:hypothetical protein [Vicinamibacterales bacterium]
MTLDRFAALRNALVSRVLDGPGDSDVGVRRAAATGTDLPADLQALVHKIRHQAYKVTDDDVARLRTKYSEDELFEIIVNAAVGASLNGLTIALRAIEQAK